MGTSNTRGPALIIVGLGLAIPQLGLAQFDAHNVSLASWLDLATFGASSGNDCWGYVSPSGREYALMGLNNQMAVVEITSPANPAIVGSIPHTDSLWADIKVYQDYAYVVNESGGGIQVVDLSNVDNGQVILTRTIASPSTSHNVALDTHSGYLYTCGSQGGSATTVIFDLSDPTNPVQVGVWDGAYEHDAQIVTYTSGPYAGQQILFGSSEGRGVDIVDVTDKSDVFLISRTPYPSVSYCHQAWTDDLQYLYINDELDSINRTTVMDITDLANPVVLGQFSSGLSATDHNLYVRDGIIYEADYHSGLRIFETTLDPVNPAQVAWFDSYPEDNNGGFDGAWSNFPFFPSGTVIVSDLDRGLFVLQPDLDFLSFSYPGGLPEVVPPGSPIPITVHIRDRGTPPDPTTVMLHTRIDGGIQAATAMTDLGGGDFESFLPAADCFSTIEFYVSAQDIEGDQFVDPQGAPADQHGADVYTQIVTVLADAFETEQGWTAGVPGDNASTGVWERVDPLGTGAQPEDDHTPAPGTMCYVTGQGSPGGSVGENDVDGGSTTLLSPALDLSSTPEAVISYWRWYSNDAGGSPNEDVFVIDVSADSGVRWSNAEIIGPSGPETSGGWVYHEFRVADLVTPSAQVRMRFVASDLGSGSIVEAAIDDFEVKVFECSATVPGDFDGDGDVDLDDHAGFWDCLFGPGQPPSPTPPTSEADCLDAFDSAGDNDVDLADFRAFQDVFTGS
ncbi:MAG: choice-of-anchor B family protein [Planctomycetota bacterium]|jgi:choice-of-anchor B domain-containing protein